MWGNEKNHHNKMRLKDLVETYYNKISLARGEHLCLQVELRN